MNERKKSDVKEWWSKNPMTYAPLHGKSQYVEHQYERGSLEFFEQLDAEFNSWNLPLHSERPFDRLFDYDAYQGQKILEIGCGMGTMSMQWAKSGAHVTAVDLSPESIAMTKKRFELFGLDGEIREADARDLPFDDSSFDYGYSWGVLHHSSDLPRSLREFMRVLRPGARFGIMLYCRHSLFYLYRILYREGFLHYENRFLGPLELASRYTDAAEQEGNAHTWPVSKREVRKYLQQDARNITMRKFGGEIQGIASAILPGLGKSIPVSVLKPWARRLGWSLWITGERKKM